MQRSTPSDPPLLVSVPSLGIWFLWRVAMTAPLHVSVTAKGHGGRSS